MKSTILSILCLLLTSVCWGQDKAAQIADVKNQIATLENETPAMLKSLETLKTERADKIDFVGAAYDKAKANFEQEGAAFQQKVAEVKHQEAILQPSIDNYNQRVQAHNAHQCTEKCVNGSCDGSCAWYTAEKNQLDANQAQLEQAAAPINAAKARLAQDASNLQETAGKLETIRTGLNDEIESWKGRVAELKAQWEAHEQKMAQLEARLAALYGSVNACMTEAQSSPTCQAPAYGPDGKPILNQDCERMVARCRSMFDGSKP
jgi:chromosome segregation ATPase